MALPWSVRGGRLFCRVNRASERDGQPDGFGREEQFSADPGQMPGAAISHGEVMDGNSRSGGDFFTRHLSRE